jgi:hypothetical protein
MPDALRAGILYRTHPEMVRAPPRPSKQKPRLPPEPGFKNALNRPSSLFDGDRVGFADFDAAFAAQTLFCVHGHGFAILELEHFHRTDIDALFAAFTFFFVHNRVKSHLKASFQKV